MKSFLSAFPKSNKEFVRKNGKIGLFMDASLRGHDDRMRELFQCIEEYLCLRLLFVRTVDWMKFTGDQFSERSSSVWRLFR